MGSLEFYIYDLSPVCTYAVATKVLGFACFADAHNRVFALLKDSHFLSCLGLYREKSVGRVARGDEMMAALTTARTLDPTGCSANGFQPSNGL